MKPDEENDPGVLYANVEFRFLNSVHLRGTLKLAKVAIPSRYLLRLIAKMSPVAAAVAMLDYIARTL